MQKCEVCGAVVHEDDLLWCEDCGRRCCETCVTTQYRNFRFYDGNVDIVDVCRVCQGFCCSEVVSNES